MKISVITACLNSEQTILETLNSVNSQTYKNFEHIIVDGKSSDSTLEIVESFDSDKLKVISGKDSGIYEAMNKGIDIATGDYLFFLNSDDKFIHDSVFEVFYKQGLKESKDLVYGTYFGIDKKTGDYGVKKQSSINKFDLWQACPLHPTVFCKKELFDKYGKFNEKYKICADYHWMTNILIKEKLDIKYIDTPVTIFDTNGISKGRSPLHLNEREEVDKIHFSPLELKLFNFINDHNKRYFARGKIFGMLFGIPSEV